MATAPSLPWTVPAAPVDRSGRGRSSARRHASGRPPLPPKRAPPVRALRDPVPPGTRPVAVRRAPPAVPPPTRGGCDALGERRGMGELERSAGDTGGDPSRRRRPFDHVDPRRPTPTHAAHDTAGAARHLGDLRARKSPRNGHSFVRYGGFLRDEFRRRPTLPGGLPPSTIGADGLNFRVRDGNGCDPVAMVTGNLSSSGRRS